MFLFCNNRSGYQRLSVKDKKKTVKTVSNRFFSLLTILTLVDHKIGFCQIDQHRQIVGGLLNTVLFNRHTLPAATFQMIEFSAADNSLPEVNVVPHERGYEPDCEQPEIAVPVRPT